MKHVLRIGFAFAATVGMAVFNHHANAGSENDRYAVISERNMFALKPPSPATTGNPSAATLPGVDFKLTGLSSLPSGKKRAFLMILRPGQTLPEYRNLVEGERAGELQLVSVHLETERVMILHRGKESWLTLGLNGIKDGAVPAYESYETTPRRRQ